MGTTGLTAQAYGARDPDETRALLGRALLIGGATALLVLALQWPIAWAAFALIDPSPEVTALGQEYFFIRIWGAPAALGNIALIVTLILGAVFFTLLLVSGNTMSQSVRERISELAVLKTLGFRDGLLFRLVLVESILITAVGGAIGVFGSKFMFGPGNPVNNFIQGFQVEWSTVILGLVLATMLGVVSGIVPAWQAMKLPVVQALRRVA